MNSFLWQPPEIPWKSPWRIDFENWLEREAAKPRPIVKAEQIQARQEREVKAPSKPRGPRKPKVPKTARRKGVRNQKRQHDWLVKRTKFCSVCQIPLNANNTHGLCKEHWQNERRVLSLGARPTCKFDGCEKKLYRDNFIGLCREHGNPVRRKEWSENNKAKIKLQQKEWNDANKHRRRKAWKDMKEKNNGL